MLKTIFLGLLLLSPAVVLSLECATSRCYIDAYSSVDGASLPALSRVKGIYKKLTKTIGSHKAMHSDLLVIESDGYPWAVALSDNTVVVTSGAIKKMYQEGDLALGDARAAFILGHELSHLETDDLFHHRAFIANRNRGIGKSTPRFLDPNPGEELRADLRGYTYATIAGYETDRLISEENNFFTGWLSGINSSVSGTHPDNQTRLTFLRDGFENILSDVPYYYYATALAHFGHYRDAQYLLEDFLDHVETREAYSNLGYIHLQRAREYMPVSMAYKFWFPTVLEPASGLDIPRSRALFDQELPPTALSHLQEAEQYLKRAISMDETEITAYLNLAVVYLYMPDKVHRAYAAIEDALRTDLGRAHAVRSQLESMYQIIRIQDDQDQNDRWPQARAKMERLANSPSAADNLLYNFARMLDDRGRDDTANLYWQRLYQNLAQLPAVYRDQVCYRLRKEQCEVTLKQPTPWQRIDLPVGKDIRYAEVQNKLKKNWSVGSPPAKLLPDLKAQIFFNQQQDSILALDNHMEMMILRNIPSQYQTLPGLLEAFGNPLVSLPLADGQVLSFDDQWSAVIKNGSVIEVWVSKLVGNQE